MTDSLITFLGNKYIYVINDYLFKGGGFNGNAQDPKDFEKRVKKRLIAP